MCLKALPYVKRDLGLSFEWSRDGGSCNELRLEKVTPDHCTGYYTCEITKNGEYLFSVHHCLKATGEQFWLTLCVPVMSNYYFCSVMFD